MGNTTQVTKFVYAAKVSGFTILADDNYGTNLIDSWVHPEDILPMPDSAATATNTNTLKPDCRPQAPSTATHSAPRPLDNLRAIRDRSRSPSRRSTLTVRVSNLPNWLKRGDLERDFGRVGAVEDVDMIMRRRDNAFTGLAYVTYLDQAGFDAAMAWNDDRYNGRVIQVRAAENRV